MLYHLLRYLDSQGDLPGMLKGPSIVILVCASVRCTPAPNQPLPLFPLHDTSVPKECRIRSCFPRKMCAPIAPLTVLNAITKACRQYARNTPPSPQHSFATHLPFACLCFLSLRPETKTSHTTAHSVTCCTFESRDTSGCLSLQ